MDFTHTRDGYACFLCGGKLPSVVQFAITNPLLRNQHCSFVAFVVLLRYTLPLEEVFLSLNLLSSEPFALLSVYYCYRRRK